MIDITRTFALIGGLIALLIFFYSQDFILISDIVLTIVFVIVALIEFGVKWRHRTWDAQVEPGKEYIRCLLSRLFWTATLLTLIIPMLSIAVAYVLRVEAPKQIDAAIAGIMTPSTPAIDVTTLTNVKIDDIPNGTSKRAYVAVFRPASEDVSLAGPVLQIVLREIDGQWRWPVLLSSVIFICVVLTTVFISEALADFRISLAGTDTNTIVDNGVNTNKVTTSGNGKT